MVAKQLRNGSVAYYWNPHVRYTRAGFPLHREALGRDYALAITRAVELNRHLDDWRHGRHAVRDLDLQPGFGTLAWLVERYKRSPAFTDKVSGRSRDEYERTLQLVLRHPLAGGAELDGLERLGVPVVLMKPKKKGAPAKPFLLRTTRSRVRKAARLAGLSEDLTLAACRHGGLTELGDAELTEQGIMALSGHREPDAARGYVKRTEIQRAIGARKRRAWVEAAKLIESVTEANIRSGDIGRQGGNK